jgi:hypothetical protein
MCLQPTHPHGRLHRRRHSVWTYATHTETPTTHTLWSDGSCISPRLENLAEIRRQAREIKWHDGCSFWARRDATVTRPAAPVFRWGNPSRHNLLPKGSREQKSAPCPVMYGRRHGAHFEQRRSTTMVNDASVLSRFHRVRWREAFEVRADLLELIAIATTARHTTKFGA